MFSFGLNIWAVFTEYPASLLLQMFGVAMGGGMLALIAGVWYPRAVKFIGYAITGIELIYLLMIFNAALKQLPF